ncbi:MAG: hypothetical protein JWP18_1414, partial [Solirubrobacterales bacterium]|nr:hypothetical protein [Solirubrobacterales bacterium]
VPPAGPAPAPARPPGALPVQQRFTTADAQRLLWRAGFGPRPGDAARLVAMGLEAAVASLVHPTGAASLVGPAPHDDNGDPLAPLTRWGHDAVAWLDRMVRSDQPLVERMTLIWHDWFAVSREQVNQAPLMLAQNELFRRNALGNLGDLLRGVTHDPAMLVFLSGIANRAGDPNENYAREIMELFTLGAGRGAYSEGDVRELARAFTGETADWVDGTGFANFRFVAARHDGGAKTIFGKTGNWTADDGWRLCLEHPGHASFFVTKLWSAFVPTVPDAGTVAALAALYVSGGHAIAPVVEAILRHPDLYDGPAMVKSPVTYAAGVLRQTGRFVETTDWAWLLDLSGQLPYFPPNVAGWDESRWLDTSTWRGRWYLAVWALRDREIDAWDAAAPYDPAETPAAAVDKALAFFGGQAITSEMRAGLERFAADAIPPTLSSWERGPYRALRQNALRLLVATCSDHQTS